MNQAKSLLLSVALTLCALPAIAETWGEAPTPVQRRPSLCPAGQAFTYVMQCDQGTRPEIDRYWGQGAGVEVCRVSRRPECQPVIDLSPDARPGYEVQDSWARGELVTVTFGADWLLGLQRR